MYQEYFGLNDEPFRMTPDTKYLFRSPAHEEAISSLIYGISQKKGFVVITGDIGTGKTTLCRAILKQLDPKTRTALILNPTLSRTELLHAILDDLGLELPAEPPPTPKMLLDRLNSFLIEQLQAGGNVAVLIDEAQNIDPDVLEFIRLLSNLETEKEKLLQIILIGQPELNELLQAPKLEQLRQRVAVRYHISPLASEDIPRYLRHRLAVAGNENAADFQPEALEAISAYTRGTPRLINIIADKCLLAAFAENTKTITAAIAAAAVADHEGPKRPAPGPEPALAPAAPAAAGSGRWLAFGGGALVAGLVLAFVAAIAIHRAPPRAAEPARVARTTAVAPILAAKPALPPARSEMLRAWGADPAAADFTGAGLVTVPVAAEMSWLMRLNLPLLLKSGQAEFALVGVTPLAYCLYDPLRSLGLQDASGDTRLFVPRALLDAAGPFEALVPLPAEWSYPVSPLTDTRLPRLLAEAERSLNPLARPWPTWPSPARVKFTVIAFQNAAGLPVDGIVGPLTWCALVSRTHPDYPRLR